MQISLVRTRVQKASIKESELVDYIKDWHEDCEYSSCDIKEAIKSNLHNRELIEVFLDVDGADGFIDHKESGDCVWMSVPTSEDTTELQIKDK